MKLLVCVAASAAAIAVVAAPAPAAPAPALPMAEAEFVPGEVVVRFRSGVGAVAAARTLDAVDASVREELALARTVVVDPGAGWSVAEAVAVLEGDPDVLFAEPNFVYRLSAIPNDPYFGLVWALNQSSDRDLDAPEAWDLTTGSRSIVVAVVDTGIAYEHPDLAANIWTNPADPAGGGDQDGNGFVDDTRGWDFVGNDKTPLDDHGHGTHVAGTIGATGNNSTGLVGVNWQVSLMALRAATQTGELDSTDVADAIAYACSKGARVVNGSFGGPGGSATILAALSSPACANTLFVFAAGNGGRDGVGDNNDLAPQYPCDYDFTRIVCVAATDRNDLLTSFSNFGATSVDVGAPGFEVWSTWPTPAEYVRADGTSMATPQVAGVAALVVARSPMLTADEVRNKILNGVDRVAALGGVLVSGGRVNALGALNAPTTPFVPTPPPPPPAPPPPAAPPATARDTAPPNTRLTRAPARTTRARTARFAFTATELGARFQCRLDRGRWTACRSPRSYRNLRLGAHTFRVRAFDAAGNVDPTPATRTWRVRT